MSDTLQEIVTYKKTIIVERKAERSLTQLEALASAAPPVKGFISALRGVKDSGKAALIAELKKASPSKGLIRETFEPLELAAAYQRGGAACLSILTDERYFQGSDQYLRDVAKASPLPILRKDFMVDPYQIVESRALGADCVLLIMAALSDAQAVELEQTAITYGLDVLVESHNAEELERALSLLQTDLIGVNNRNLKTLQVDMQTSITLHAAIPQHKLAVCESGISTHKDVATMMGHGYSCFLVGESLMRHQDVAQATKTLLVG